MAVTLGLKGTAMAAPSASACSVGSSEAADELIRSAATSLISLMEAEPDAPGLQELEEFFAATYPAEMDSEDDRLLQGAVYLQLQSIAERYDSPPSEEELRERLSAPVLRRRNPEYYSLLLERTRERVACDPAYAAAIAQGAEQAQRFIIECTGTYHACWVACRHLLELLMW
ncbi:hypothetical protein ACLESD_28620 [Pyxidicoccus sp. 3LFB2]